MTLLATVTILNLVPTVHAECTGNVGYRMVRTLHLPTKLNMSLSLSPLVSMVNKVHSLMPKVVDNIETAQSRIEAYSFPSEPQLIADQVNPLLRDKLVAFVSADADKWTSKCFGLYSNINESAVRRGLVINSRIEVAALKKLTEEYQLHVPAIRSRGSRPG